MLKDFDTNHIVAYAGIIPVSNECYDSLRKGILIDTSITTEMILKYKSGWKYKLYFSSIVVHPDYRDICILRLMYKTIMSRFDKFKIQSIFIEKILADAVNESGKKLCKLIGMKKIRLSNHNSEIYEILFDRKDQT